jgi:hypothetical protein
MKASIKTVVALALGALALVAPAHSWAVTPINLEFSATRLDTAGTTITNMTSSATTFCFLTKVGIENTDFDGELAQCRVRRGVSVWTVEAFLGGSNEDADARCSAQCYFN